MPDAVIKKCFAYNIDGLRCMQTAGHDGDHAHVIAWTDAECFDPTVMVPPQVAAAVMAQPSEPAPPMTAPEAGEPCVVCNHPAHLHDTEIGCQATQVLEDGYADGEKCGCREFV